MPLNQRRPATPPAPPASPKRNRLEVHEESAPEAMGQDVPASTPPSLGLSLSNDSFNGRPYYPHPVSPHCYPIDPSVNRTQCFICHGHGHWARDCTSLPAMYLVTDAPRCFTCGGSGHYARFCPNTMVMMVADRMSRPRVHSLPPLPAWGSSVPWFYEGEYAYDTMTPQVYRPDETPRYYCDTDSETGLAE